MAESEMCNSCQFIKMFVDGSSSRNNKKKKGK